MKLQAGERYITRSGKITSKLYSDTKYLNSFRGKVDGTIYTWNNDGIHPDERLQALDLIEKYVSINSPEKLTAAPKTDKSNTGLVLIPFHSLFRLGAIFIEGLRYGKDNWKKGVNDKNYQEERLEHALVHLAKWKEGDRTEDHLAKVAWFCFTQMELERLESLHVSVSNDSTN